MTGCEDVCEEILQRLEELGFVFDGTENHDDVLMALGEIILSRREAN